VPREVEIARALVGEVRAGSRSVADAICALPLTFLAPTSLSLDVDPRAGDAYRGVPAGTGAASGAVVFRPEDAETAGGRGESVLLVVDETFPEDIAAMTASRGIIAVRGGLTGHAAIVARGLGRPCLCGGGGMSFAEHPTTHERTLRVEITDGSLTHLEAGDVASFDGATGVFVRGTARLKSLGDDVDQLLGWASALATGAPVDAAPPLPLAAWRLDGETPTGLLDRARKLAAAAS